MPGATVLDPFGDNLRDLEGMIFSTGSSLKNPTTLKQMNDQLEVEISVAARIGRKGLGMHTNAGI